MSRFRKSGSEGASALLQKVNSQLRGEKPGQDEDDEGLGEYLSGLGKSGSVKYRSKQASIDWDKFDELSDKSVSVSDDDHVNQQPVKHESPGSKFLKKKPHTAAEEPVQIRKNSSQQKSSALSKASKFTSGSYEPKTTRPELVRMLSDSDMEISLSADNSHIQLGDAASLIPATKPRSRSRTPEKSVVSEPSEKSSSIGKGGARFMKKPSATAQPVSSPPKVPQPVPRPAPQAKKTEATPVQQPKTGQKSHFRVPAVGSKAAPVYAQDADSDSSSMSIGKGGSRFLKKKPTGAPPPEKIDSPKSPKVKKPKVNQQTTNQKRDQFTLKSSLKYGTEVQLDTSEESLADYIQGLDSGGKSSNGSRQSKGKRQTPRTPSRSATLLDEIKEEEEQKSAATLSDDDSYKVNVFDVDALDPVNIASSFEADEAIKYSPKSPRHSPKHTPRSRSSHSGSKSSSKKSKIKKQKAVTDASNDDFFSNFGLQTVEDLLGPSVEERGGGGDSEIGTDIEDQEDRSLSPLRSILSPSPKPDKTPRTSRSRVHYSLEEITEIRSRSPSPNNRAAHARKAKSDIAQYSEDFDDASIRTESEIRTEQPTSDIESITEHIGSTRTSARTRKYSDDFMSATESKWSSMQRDIKRAESVETTADYSDDFSDISETASETIRKSRSKVKSVEVQTHVDPGDLIYQWDSKFMGRPIVPPGLGLGSVDPSPIATHVVTAESLEAVTAYSPSVIALNEMLRQQLLLTENFIAIQKHLHQNLIQHAQPDFSYTTLQETKAYIKRHRPSKLTFDEALRQVKEDMGLD